MKTHWRNKSKRDKIKSENDDTEKRRWNSQWTKFLRVLFSFCCFFVSVTVSSPSFSTLCWHAYPQKPTKKDSSKRKSLENNRESQTGMPKAGEMLAKISIINKQEWIRWNCRPFLGNHRGWTNCSSVLCHKTIESLFAMGKKKDSCVLTSTLGSVFVNQHSLQISVCNGKGRINYRPAIL